MKSLALAAVLAAAFTAPAIAADPAPVSRAYASPAAFIATTVTVPPGYTTIYVSGLTPSPVQPAMTALPPAAGAGPNYGTTEQQAESIFGKIEAALAAQGASAADVVSMRVYLVGDLAKGGKMDFAGMMAAYSRHFGTPTQPNKPSRTTVQVVALAGAGMLAEIEVIAVKKP